MPLRKNLFYRNIKGWVLIFVLMLSAGCSLKHARSQTTGTGDAQEGEPGVSIDMNEIVIKHKEVIGADYFLKGSTYWFKPIPFKIKAPRGWQIYCEEGYNPRVVMTSPDEEAQAELYWLTLYHKLDLAGFIDSFLDKYDIEPLEKLKLAHPDGELVCVSAGETDRERELFFLKSGRRVYILSCSGSRENFSVNEKKFFFIIDNFRLFEGYKIK